MSERSVAPGLLIAMPQLPDPNFERSVVLMVKHDDEGSFGLVINRPSELQVSEVMRAMGVEWLGDPDDPVWYGGPVMPRTGWLLHTPVERVHPEGAIQVTGEIELSTSPEQLRALAAAPPPRVRFLMGYAGWGAAQLEHELVEGTWLLAEASPELCFDTEAEHIWEQAIRSLGVDPTTLAPAHGVH